MARHDAQYTLSCAVSVHTKHSTRIKSAFPTRLEPLTVSNVLECLQKLLKRNNVYDDEPVRLRLQFSHRLNYVLIFRRVKVIYIINKVLLLTLPAVKTFTFDLLILRNLGFHLQMSEP